MRKKIAKLPKQKIAFGACVALFSGLIFSKFLISLALIILLLTALLTLIETQNITAIWQNKTYLATLGIFFMMLLSAFLSDNWEEGFTRVQRALPLLILPLSFAYIPPFSKRQYYQLLSLFVGAMSLACLGVLVNYAWNYAAMQQLLNESGAIPTPNSEHIRFSLLVNLGIFAGVELLKNGFCWKSKAEKWLILASVFLLSFAIHILSVRIGLVIFYVGTVLSILYFILQQKRYILGGFSFLLVLLLPYLAVQYVPSINMKYRLTVYNIELFRQGEIGDYSDTQRLLSYQIALKIAKKTPYFGVGLGDVYDQQKRIYVRRYPEQKIMYPHNMLLSIYVAMGLVGLVCFLLFFFYPLFDQRQYQNYFFLLFFCTIFLSFMTENTLFRTVGVGIYTYFLLLTANYMQGSSKE